ncbi:glycoside hydrolase family 57 protein [Desulfurococcaceae archaeon MEX13E-LK6-19]|nr:glycoside hydrolase family 57 protein [Desulfurococcaceae archaeon MEX13E-LK6-19]
MPDVVFMFEVHQPYRLDRRAYEKLLEKGLRGNLSYRDLEEAILDNGLNKLVMERASARCYIPATSIIIENIKKYKNSYKPFKVSYSISGVFIEQASRWAPRVIDLFKEAVDTGMVEIIEQTYYHSLAAFIPPDFDELREQVLEHRKLVKELFGVEPVSIENTEFMYNNDIAGFFHSLGYKVMLTEGVDWVLGWRSPNYVYKAYGSDIRVLTRNYRLSDDIGYRFSDRNWDQYPLTADKYASWLAATPGDVIFIAIDYETFGEHHWPETGIYEFLKWLPGEILKWMNLYTSTPSEAAFKHPVRDVIDVPPWSTISWADERDISAWLGNHMQRNAFKMLIDLRPYIKAINKPELTRLWKLMTISDHYYYIATKFGSIEQVHSYFSPYKNAPDAYAILVQALSILTMKIAEELRKNPKKIALRIILPDDKAFHFHRREGEYLWVKANSIKEFIEKLEHIPLESVLYHLHRGDIQNWLRNIFALDDLAKEIDEIARERLPAEEKRNKLLSILRRYFEL